jgi:hypothetical protein
MNMKCLVETCKKEFNTFSDACWELRNYKPSAGNRELRESYAFCSLECMIFWVSVSDKAFALLSGTDQFARLIGAASIDLEVGTVTIDGIDRWDTVGE